MARRDPIPSSACWARWLLIDRLAGDRRFWSLGPLGRLGAHPDHLARLALTAWRSEGRISAKEPSTSFSIVAADTPPSAALWLLTARPLDNSRRAAYLLIKWLFDRIPWNR